MTPAVSNSSRRAFLRRLLPPTRPTPSPQPSAAPAEPPLAVVAGRFCLAYQHLSCSVCRERCPVPGAVAVERGIPRINPALCNGCRLCHDVCPAPVNAIRLIPRPASLPVRHPATFAPA